MPNMTLIQKLDENQHLDPDALQRKISKRGWFQMYGMSRDEIMAYDQKPMMISLEEQSSGGRHYLNAAAWTDLATREDSSWWFCLESEWDGEPPCPS